MSAERALNSFHKPMKAVTLMITCLLVATSTLSAQCDTLPVVADTCEFKTLLNRHDGILIDVRTAQEWQTGYIEGAVNIDFRSADFNARIARLDTAKTYYVYCEVGGRARMAAEYMISQGFCRVVVLQGGIRKWIVAGYPVITPEIKNKK